VIGSTLAHFRITARLGEGGMGEVWQAEDQTLGRAVAIKLLPEAMCGDPERLARFEREARVLAALNHAGIAAVYSFERGEIGGRSLHFLVMELAEGETLHERIARGPLPLDEALPIALQIATALEAAHERGIVHRDLKPANIKVSPGGEVKVLDFGLAKALGAEADETEAGRKLAESTTLSLRMTQAGMLLGTAAYMSPEQVRGHAADKRSDVWAFGLVLAEMLTGKAAFPGDTISDTLAGVLRAEPDWKDLPPQTPRTIRALLERCVDKNPRTRLRDIGEARIAIERYLADPAAGAPAVAESSPAARSASRMGWLPWTLAVLALVSGAWALWRARQSEPRPLVRFTVGPVAGSVVLDQYPALDIARDGRRIAFTGRDEAGVRHIFLRAIDDVATVPLAGTEEGRNPFFSPDGKSVAFFTFGELKRAPVTAGTPAVLTKVQNPRGGTWVSDSTLVLPLATDGGLYTVPATGGEPRPLTELDASRNERSHRWPAALPDGRTVLFTSDSFETTEYYDDARIEAVTLDDGKRTVVLEGSSRACYLPTGHLLFARDGSVYAVAFDATTLATHGEPVPVLQGVATSVASGAVHFAVADDGTLAYVPGGTASEALNLAWASADGSFQPVDVGQQNQLQQVARSPDGRQAAVTASLGPSSDIWIVDLERSTWSRLTFAGNNWDPAWSPDGLRIAFASVRDGKHYRPYWKAADGSSDDELLWDSPETAFPSSFSPDGKLLAVEVRSADSASDIWIVPLDGSGEPYPFLRTPRIEWHATFSPDGRWLAYSSSDTGRNEIYVRPFPGPGGRWQISTDGGNEPRWFPDGKSIYFRYERGLYRVEIDTSGTFRAGMPQLVLSEAYNSPFNHMFDLTADGSRFLLMRPAGDGGGENQIVVTLNWAREFRRLMQP
jgi:serine/threonine-protein kinase